MIAANWKIKIKDWDGKMKWAKNMAGVLKGKKAKFEKRQQARQFCRNHLRFAYDVIELHGPNGERENFNWNGFSYA